MLGQLQLAHIFGMKQKQYIITIYGKCNWLHQWIKGISYYLLRAVTNQKMSDMHGSTMMHITMGDMNKTKIPIPPLSEQQQIATYLDTKCSKIDHIIATQKKKIAYLQELKQSLITNVVTGKIKVS